MNEVAERISPYPPFAQGEEARRRWRLVTYAGLMIYGFQVGDALDRGDRTVIWNAQRSLFGSDVETGPGDLLGHQVEWLVVLGLL